MAKTEPIYQETARAFEHHFGHKPELAVFAPGRANIIGEHTDYNDGHVLPFAIDLGTCVAVRNRADQRMVLCALNFDEDFSYDLDSIPDDRPGWVSYVAGVISEMQACSQHRFSGKEIAIFSNVPIGSGLSSSAALEIAIATAIERSEEIEIDDATMVDACRRADRKFVGVNSGPMDQFASRACIAHHAGLLDCRSLELTHHRIPEGLSFLSVDSGITRKLAESAYNERVAGCGQAVEVVAGEYAGVQALRDVTLEMLESLQNELDVSIFRLARHVVTEQARVFDVVDALEKKEFRSIGSLLLKGHQSLSEDYRVSTPLIDKMVDWLADQPGILGARLTGAGFGGSLICVCDKTCVDIESIDKKFKEAFSSQCDNPPSIRSISAEDGARHMEPLWF